jgi:hypothetical protein
MIRVDSDLIERLARKYIWWKTPEEAAEQPERVIAQVMNIGDFADVQALGAAVGDSVLIDVLSYAQAGEFNPRSRAYWHYRLHLAEPGQLPPMPVRKLG